jgi:hypothetical protein
MTLVNLDAGILFFFAIGSSSELSVFMAGWSSRNKYSLLGAMRAVAQMISYEVPLLMSSLAVVMITGSLNANRIVDAQNQYTYGLPHWYIFTPWGFAGFLLFAVAATAETNRSPFDLPEGESELVAGYFTEYSGFKFALFFLGEYVGMMGISGLGTTLFLGGYSAPLQVLGFVHRQDHAFHVRLYLGARNAAAFTARPAHELCLEVCSSTIAVEPVCGGGMAVHGPRVLALGRLFGSAADCLCGDGARGYEARALRTQELPLCGVKGLVCGEFRFIHSGGFDGGRRIGRSAAEEHGALRAGAHSCVCRAGAAVS